MKLSVYYEEIDGELLPMWLLLPVKIEEEFETYSVEAPFERFYPEDFHDDLKIITVSQGALTRCPFIISHFNIHIPTIKRDLEFNGKSGDIIFDAHYFLVRVDDLEELLLFDIKRQFRD